MSAASTEAPPVCTLIPLGDRMVIRRDEALKLTPGGLHLPDDAQKKATQGTVLAVGPGAWDERGGCHRPIDVEDGQRVLFSTYAGIEVEHKGEKLVILKEEDVLAVMG